MRLEIHIYGDVTWPDQPRTLAQPCQLAFQRLRTTGDAVYDRFVGSWRLVSFVSRSADGRETDSYGAAPLGFLIYDEGSRMFVQIASADQEPFASGDPSGASAEELRTAFDEYFGYFGRYTVDESAGTITHHVEGASHPNFAGTDQRRYFTLLADHLVLRTAPEEMGEAGVTYVATWERQPRGDS